MFKDLVEYIVKALVDYPEQVEVTEISGNTAVVIEVSVADSDMGRVIGRRGRVINSIRAIVDVLAAKQGKRVNLEILES